MKRKIYIVCFMTMLFALPIPTRAAETRPVATVVVDHWPPWEIAYDEQKQEVSGGIAVELLQELFTRLDMDMKLENVPWKRALHYIETGEADLIPLVVQTPERAVYMEFTEPMYIERALLCYSTDHFEQFEWEQWDDLKGLRIGIVSGYAPMEAVIEEHGLTAESVNYDEQNVKKLIAGRIDLAIFYSSSLPLLKDVPGHERLRFAQKPLLETSWHNGISKQSFLVEKLAEINTILQEMKQDGTFQRILKDLYQE